MPEINETRAAPAAGGLWTRDLYLGALLMCRGFSIAELSVNDVEGRPIAAFRFDGDRKVLEEIDAEYRTGRATANVALLKFCLTNLKEQIFSKIRFREARGRMVAGWRPREIRLGGPASVPARASAGDRVGEPPTPSLSPCGERERG